MVQIFIIKSSESFCYLKVIIVVNVSYQSIYSTHSPKPLKYLFKTSEHICLREWFVILVKIIKKMNKDLLWHYID